jgi:hypothetical protein
MKAFSKKNISQPTPEHLRTMEKAFTYVIETAPEKSYLALVIKPYIEYANAESLRILYSYLNSSHDSARYIRDAIRTVMLDCKTNERLHEIIQIMIQRFYV